VNILFRRYRLLTVLNSVKRESYGEFYLLLAGIATMAIPDSWLAYFIAFIVLGICDSLAAIVGQNLSIPDGIRFSNGKTLNGSIAFFSCMAIACGVATTQNINFDLPIFLYLLDHKR
jgi:dolichol kinase